MYIRQIIGKSGDDYLSGTMFTSANITGVLGGFIGGLGCGVLLGLPWWGIVVNGFLFALLGGVGSYKVDGVYVYQRVSMLIMFYVGKRAGSRLVAATSRHEIQATQPTALYDDDDQPIFVPVSEDAHG